MTVNTEPPGPPPQFDDNNRKDVYRNYKKDEMYLVFHDLLNIRLLRKNSKNVDAILFDDLYMSRTRVVRNRDIKYIGKNQI